MAGTPASAQRYRLLVSPSLPRGHVVLGEAPVLIGRGRDCAAPLPVEEVSRRHARVVWDARGFHLVQDLDSTNGTKVNGEDVGRAGRRLEHDDTIAVGPFVLRYAIVQATREELERRYDPQGSDTAAILVTPLKGGSLAGKFQGEVLLEAVQLIELNRYSGILTVRTPGLQGKVSFRDGAIVDATIGVETGASAARRALALKTGDYAFELAGATKPTGALSLRPSTLALEITRVRGDAAGEKTRPMARPRPEPGAR